MIELYHNDMSVCAQKVRFTLGAKALPWTSHHLNLRAGDQQKPEYVKLNPSAVVPTLVDDGKVIIESTVINEYLDDAYPEPGLRLRMRLIARGFAFGPSNWTRPCTPRPERSATPSPFAIRSSLSAKRLWKHSMKRFPDPKKRAESWENVTKGIDSSYFVDATRRFDKLLADMEAALIETPWLAGTEFSLADIGYAPYILRLQDLQLEFLWDRRPHVSAWFERVGERKGYKAAFDDWPNPSYAALMKETGAEAEPRIKAVLGLA